MSSEVPLVKHLKTIHVLSLLRGELPVFSCWSIQGMSDVSPLYFICRKTLGENGYLSQYYKQTLLLTQNASASMCKLVRKHRRPIVQNCLQLTMWETLSILYSHRFISRDAKHRSLDEWCCFMKSTCFFSKSPPWRRWDMNTFLTKGETNHLRLK